MRKRCTRHGALLVALTGLLGSFFGSRMVVAAEVTDVPDAADVISIGNLERPDPFDFYLGTEFEFQLGTGRLTREPINRPGIDPNDMGACVERNARDCRPVDELDFKRTRSVLHVTGEMGIYHDLALTFGWQYVVSDTLRFSYAPNVDASNSSIEQEGLFQPNYSSKHQGSGPFDLGLKWAPLSDERDDSKPSWVIIFNWSMPWTAETFDPQRRPQMSDPGGVGDGVHRLTFGTSLSKRIANLGLIAIDPELYRRGYIDPYMEFLYTYPIPQRSYANSALTSGEFPSPPPHEARFNAGFEIVPIENIKKGFKLAVDLGVRSTFYSQGRTFTEVSDPLGRPTYTEQYLQIGGLLGLYAQFAEYVRLKASFMAAYNTEHFLTNENVGEDRNGDNQVLDDGTDAINPNYDGRWDAVGRRLRAERYVVLSSFLNLMFTF